MLLQDMCFNNVSFHIIIITGLFNTNCASIVIKKHKTINYKRWFIV